MTEVIAPVVNFSVVAAVLYFGARKGVLGMLSGRAETVRKEISEAETLFGQASKSLSENESNHKNREANAKREMDDAKTTVTRHREKTMATAKTEAERIKREAKMMGSNEVESAKRLLQTELAEKSLEMASIYLDKHMEPKDKNKLVQEYVDLVKNAPS